MNHESYCPSRQKGVEKGRINTMQNAECLALSVTGVVTAAARAGAQTFPQDAPKNFCGQVVCVCVCVCLNDERGNRRLIKAMNEKYTHINTQKSPGLK